MAIPAIWRCQRGAAKCFLSVKRYESSPINKKWKNIVCRSGWDSTATSVVWEFVVVLRSERIFYLWNCEKGTKNCAGFAATPQTAGVMVTMSDKSFVKMEKALYLWAEGTTSSWLADPPIRQSIVASTSSHRVSAVSSHVTPGKGECSVMRYSERESTFTWPLLQDIVMIVLLHS